MEGPINGRAFIRETVSHREILLERECIQTNKQTMKNMRTGSAPNHKTI